MTERERTVPLEQSSHAGDGEVQFRQIVDNAATGIAVTSLSHRFLYANAAYCALLGYTLDELRQRDASMVTLAEDVPEMHRLTQELLAGGRSSYVVERLNRTKAGDLVWLRRSVSVQRDLHGRPVGFVGVVQDISQQKAAEAALSRSQSLLRVASRISRLGAWEMALPGGAISWSDEMCLIHGKLPGFVPDIDDILSFYRQDHLGPMRAALQACAQQVIGFEMEAELLPVSGVSSWVHAIAEAERDTDGRIIGIRGVVQDISQRKRAEQRVSENEERFRLLAQATQDVIWDWNLVNNRVWYSDSMWTLFGYASGDELIDDTRNWDARSASTVWLSRIHPDDREAARASLSPVMDGLIDQWQHGYRYQRVNGTYVAVVDRGFVVRDAQGRPQRMIGGLRDVTERRMLEEQLRQSQRLEVVGQLTGGLAHDFNNLLTVIMGNAEMLVEELPSDDGLRELARMIDAAAQRGAELTQRMLAFARRQPLEPRAVNIDLLIAGMDALLRRTLGEHIEIVLLGGHALWHALVDPAQLESALLNLCLNARDAMPGGGRLTIETHNQWFDQECADRQVDLAAGPYVMVAVSDTGTGIAPEHLGRVIEPFFTTKELGKGTGLGLSMVYGFVKQSRGHVNIYSELGQGTTVKMYLPRVLQAQSVELKVAPATMDGGTGTILVVEDDELVRRYAAGQLVSLGYQVVEASTGPEALRIIEQDTAQTIGLLFTDVVMPGGMNGRALADAVHVLRPALPVLFTSGYTENTIIHHGRLDTGVQLLSKPYRRAELARRVREMMHGPEPE